MAIDEPTFARAISGVGFKREDRPGRLLVGYYHPDLVLGVQVVSGRLFDGRTDRSKLRVVPVEDLIADRLAQYAAVSPPDTSMLAQARELLRLVSELDEVYPAKRIAEEAGDARLVHLLEAPHAAGT